MDRGDIRLKANHQVSYAELHCHSAFSFLDGSSAPEALVAESTRLGLNALALTDHGGLYGAVRFAEATRAAGLPAIYGAEVTIERPALHAGTARVASGPRVGMPDPPGAHLIILARDLKGYTRLCQVLSDAHLAGEGKEEPRCTLEDLSSAHIGFSSPKEGGSGHNDTGHWMVLTGCRKGTVPLALLQDGPAMAKRALDELIDAFGHDHLAVELWDHGDPLDTPRNDVMAEMAATRNLPIVATNNVHYATPSGYRLYAAFAAVRARRTMAEMAGWIPATPIAHLRSPAEQERRFARWPGAVRNAADLGADLSFDLRSIVPGLPRFLVPAGHDEQSWLVELTYKGATEHYGPRDAERVPGAWAQIDHELSVIGALGFSGYFLVVWDIVEICRQRSIYCQGRGSAANSAVCYALGITRVDAVSLGLVFERFLSPARDGPPDIDIDIESSRRDEVIAYVYERYGRHHAAQVASVITYGARSAVRDLGKVLGYPPERVRAWARRIDRGEKPEGLPALLHDLVTQAIDLPRHLGLHSGGMVICDRPLVEVCPVEKGRYPGRTVLQWDKDSIASMGLVKFDLLGLGMLDALHKAVDLIALAYGTEVDLALLPQEEAVYDMLCEADTVGVFQVESRAQMATLPRMQPRRFADLVVEVALIRPGPIQGGSVHPYLRRRQGLEEPTLPHPLLERALSRTLGVPLFQEQLMQIAVDVAGFSLSEADALRQAMGAKRSGGHMSQLQDRLLLGMVARGIQSHDAVEIYEKLAAFSSFGFPESHAISFAYLVYASAWLKVHYPAALLAGLLNAQPMGFWSPQSLVADARRHGVILLRPHVNASSSGASLEKETSMRKSEEIPKEQGDTIKGRDRKGRDSESFAVRLGLTMVRGLGENCARRIVHQAPYASLEDLVIRVSPNLDQLEALALSGALEGLPAYTGGPVIDGRRAALWMVGSLMGNQSTPRPAKAAPAKTSSTLKTAACASSRERGSSGRLFAFGRPGTVPSLDPLTLLEEARADLWATGVTIGVTPMEIARRALSSKGACSAKDLRDHPVGKKVLVAGVVTHRQRPESANGTVFINLEDETGMVNVVCSRGAWIRWQEIARHAPALLVRGRLERCGSAVTVLAYKIEALDLGSDPIGIPSHF